MRCDTPSQTCCKMELAEGQGGMTRPQCLINKAPMNNPSGENGEVGQAKKLSL